MIKTIFTILILILSIKGFGQSFGQPSPLFDIYGYKSNYGSYFLTHPRSIPDFGTLDSIAIASPRAYLGWINVQDYGAVGDSSTDNTIAFQNAFNAVPAQGAVVYFPAGRYIFSGNISITNKCIVQGVGGVSNYASGTSGQKIISPSSSLICNSLTHNGIIVDTDFVQFDNIGIRNNQMNPTSGAGILWERGFNGRMDNVSVDRFYNNVVFVNVDNFNISNCKFDDPVSKNLWIQDSSDLDGGDNSIYGCYFNGGFYSGITDIYWTSGGGLKITNCKFNTTSTNHPSYCIYASIGGTADFLINNCSLENFSVDAIHIQDSLLLGPFSDLNITGNEIDAETTASGYGINLIGNSTYPINYGSISGNIINGPFSTSTAINMSYVDNIKIGDNASNASTLISQSNSSGILSTDYPTWATVMSNGATSTIAPTINVGATIGLTINSSSSASNTGIDINQAGADTMQFATYPPGAPAVGPVLSGYGYILSNAGFSLASGKGSIRFGSEVHEWGRFDSTAGVFYAEDGISTTNVNASTLSAGNVGVQASSSPSYNLDLTTGATDAKNWSIIANTNALTFEAVNDADNAQSTFLAVNRSGYAISSVQLPTLTTNGIVQTSGSNGTLVVSNTLPTGSTSYIQNQTASGQSASFWIAGNGTFTGAIATSASNTFTGGFTDDGATVFNGTTAFSGTTPIMTAGARIWGLSAGSLTTDSVLVVSAGVEKKIAATAFSANTSGTYTPTTGSSTGATAITVTSATYTQTGNILHICIGGSATYTSGTPVNLVFSTPFTTTNSSQYEVGVATLTNGTTSITSIIPGISLYGTDIITAYFLPATTGSGYYTVEADIQVN